MTDATPELAIGIDIGGTKIAAGLVDTEGRIRVRRETPTEPGEGPAAVIARTAELVRAFDGEVGESLGVGVGVAGLVRARDGVVAQAPNLRWEDVALGPELSAALGGRAVRLDNDANAAAVGEVWAGAARGRAHVIVITLGTGVGGGLILDGSVYRGARSVGAELGHITVDPDGPVCGCGNPGCLEALASGTAVGRIARERLVTAPDVASSLRSGAIEAVTARDVVAAAEAGDAFSKALLGETGVWLGVALASFVNLFNPEAIVIGGGMAAAGDLILAPARREMERRAFTAALEGVEIVLATLGNDAGIVGAAALVLDPKLAGLAFAREARDTPLTPAEAIEALTFHCGSNPNVEDPRWEQGFLSMLRPYKGLRPEVYDHLVQCVRTLLPHLKSAPKLDRRVISSLWGICHLARYWGLHPDGMLRRNGLITEEDQATLERWIEELSYDLMSILDGGEGAEGPLA